MPDPPFNPNAPHGVIVEDPQGRAFEQGGAYFTASGAFWTDSGLAAGLMDAAP